jgi:GTP:adenosylcobinamide-phosphate guanylyltransferase
MKAILLAAGRGSRISRMIEEIPKSTLPIAGKPLIRMTVELLISEGIDVVVCVGYKDKLVKKALEGLNVKYYYNPFYDVTNSIASLWMAKNEINDDLIIANADVYFSKDILYKILNDKREAVMAIDKSRAKVGDYFFSTTDNGCIIKYGKEKGVGIWLYLNDVAGTNYPIEETLKQYEEWGAAGVKYGFMNGNSQQKNEKTRQITELCAKHHLLINFHDYPVHPYGQERTWPNAVTREYCKAQLDGHQTFEPKTFVTSVFVNMIAGPIDMNNGFMDLRQGRTTRVDNNQEVHSTVSGEMARTLITYSGVTIIPDIPEYYEKYPSLLRFLSAQKMPWKESKTLMGEIGEYIVMMRQSAEGDYLIGAATNEEARTLEIPLNFLDKKGSWTMEITQDAADTHYLTNRETYSTRTEIGTSKGVLKLELAPGGGACVLLKKR